MPKGFGAIPSRPDLRDHPVRRYMAVAPAALPAEFAAGPPVPIYDQDIYGMCVAFTLAEVKECEEARERRVQTRFAPAFIYGNRAPTDYKGEGMEPREALKCLQASGVCPWDMYPMLGTFERCRAGITPAMRDAALPQVIVNYARAPVPDDLKTAIYRTGPCMLCIPVYESFMKPFLPSGKVPRVNSSERLLGYHAMMVYGWTADGYWRVQNSWGEIWGAGGRCLIPLDYFTLSPDAPETRRMEGWAIVDQTAGAGPFPDVEPGRWSAEAIAKCKAAGILVGDPDGNFYPARAVTREELAVVIARALKL